jgi:hypothetical protein
MRAWMRPSSRLTHRESKCAFGSELPLVVAIGLIWSVAVMSEWVPVNSVEMRTAVVSPHVITVSQGESASAE